MPSSLRRLSKALLCSGAVLCAALAPAQEGGTPPSVSTELRSAQDALKSVQADSELDGTLKADLVKRYSEAVAQLKAAEASRKQAETFRAALANFPAQTKDLEAELQQLEAVGEPEPLSEEEKKLESSEVKTLLERERTAFAGLKKELEDLEALVLMGRGRPDGIASDLPNAQAAVRKAEADLLPLQGGDPSDLLKSASAVLVRARKTAAEAEIEKLEQEQLSASVRLRHHVANRDVQRIKVGRAEKRVRGLVAQAGMQLSERVGEAGVTAAAARRTAERFPSLQPLADKITGLANQLGEVAEDLYKTDERKAKVQVELEELTDRHAVLLKEVEFGERGAIPPGGTLSHPRNLTKKRDLERRIAQRKEISSDARLAALEVDTELRRIRIPPETPGDPEAGARRELLESRRNLLQQLDDEYRRLNTDLGTLNLKERQLLALTGEYKKLLGEKLFWVPTVEPVGGRTLRELPRGLQWMLGLRRWKELWDGLSRIARSSLLVWALLLASVLFRAFRKRMRRYVESFAPRIRRVSTDRYSYTIQALGNVLLRSLPTSLFILVVGRRLIYLEESSEWLTGIGLALAALSPFVFFLLFTRELTRKGGMAESHFAWSRTSMQRWQKAVIGYAWGCIPLVVVIVTTLSDSSSQHVHSLVRVSMILVMIWTAVWAAYLISPKNGVLAALLKAHPVGLVAKTRHLWVLLAIGTPLAIVVLLVRGYLQAAIQISNRFEWTAVVVVGALFVYELLLRWFSIRERKLALARMLEERRARREAAREVEELDQSEEEVPAEEEIDLVLVGAQTRKLLKSVVVIGVLIVLRFSWGGVHPVFQTLQTYPLFWEVSAADLFSAIIVVIATVLVSRNLPGLLEIAILQNLPLDSGSRYAISTLCRYLVVAIGFLVAFSVLNLEWSRFGWIAAALSVGLGFGLQEIVANFVCGIILLFERPMRIGDVVTVGTVSGKVTRIRMRATTITDWDRKEYIVPNKEFVTGHLLNWTLSSRMTRVTVGVGVAYGTNTDQVRQILTEIAAANTIVLDDPAPIITFRNFGDSSLDFEVRCYLPDAECRLQVYHEMHSEIHRLFAEEGIEIPFPQRDLHMRGGGSGTG